MRFYSVYKHTSPSGKVYIGITSKKPERRWAKGAGYKENPYMMKAVSKYGWDNFTHDILLTGLSKAEAEQAEVKLIRQYRSDERDFGYNIEHGGHAVGHAPAETRARMSASRMGHPTSEATRRKLSEAHRGVKCSPEHVEAIRKAAKKRRGIPLPESTKEKIRAAALARIRTPEHCANISRAKMGHAVSAETRKKISETKLNSPTTARGENNAKAHAVLCVETGVVYPTVAAAVLASGARNISRCCRGQRRTCGGYHWKYYEEGQGDVDR